MHLYQKKMFAFYAAKKPTLLIVPTGGGKTLASFLPSIIDIEENNINYLHTLYVSPLKALTSDIKRNLLIPLQEMDLKLRVETRTGDTTSYQRKKQRLKPPQILLTTPESLMLLLSYTDSRNYFKNLKLVIIDEIHSFAVSKRGDLTSLALAKLSSYAPDLIRFGLSATVADTKQLAGWLGTPKKPVKVYSVVTKSKPVVEILSANMPIPYSGFMARYAVGAIYETILKNRITIVFVNTRAQCEFMFRQLWEVNSENLPIAIYHGSLSKEQRDKTANLTVAGNLKAIVATSALELGIDWGNVDCVIQVGAPKGVSRLLQRIGRSNHQFNKSSQAKVVPANCFEAIECQAAINSIELGKLDGEKLQSGSLDVVVQYIINSACSETINPNQIYKEVCSAYPYKALSKTIYQQLFQFALNGGYTLKHYEQYHRLIPISSTQYKIASTKIIRRHRQNIGTIIESAQLKVKILYKKKYKIVGNIEEIFAQQLTPGDTFLFAGEVLAFERIRDMFLEARKVKTKEAKLPSYEGGSMPLTTYLANSVREMLCHSENWAVLPAQIQSWLSLQAKFSILPDLKNTLIEIFNYKKTIHMLVYSFAGRRANHTLGMLMTQRMEKNNLKPLSFTATDYGLAIVLLREPTDENIYELLSTDIINQELETWLQHSPLLKRTFRQIAIIAGLTERQHGGTRKSMKQVTFSTDLIYDVLLKHEHDHILLKITRENINRDLLDIDRLHEILKKFQNKIIIKRLFKPSPLSIPILTAIKTERVKGSAMEELLSFVEIEKEACKLINEVKELVTNLS